MAILKPDAVTSMGGVTVNEYLLTKHNPNGIDIPQTSMDVQEVVGVTVHNTDWITVAKGTTPAEQYTRATVNGNMRDVRVHYYVDNTCAWQNLPLTLSGWHAADGSGTGNRRTIAIECIMSAAYNDNDKKSEDNCARLAAALLKKHGLPIMALYTHTHWLNVLDGKKGTTDELNVMWNRRKTCPAYIIPHWQKFKELVAMYMDAGQPAAAAGEKKQVMYRVRKSWADASSQIGAYSVLKNAVTACGDGYSVYDDAGEPVYTKPENKTERCPYTVPSGVVKIGAKGEPARWLQWQLIKLGFHCGNSGVDGDFGRATERGLKYFQETYGLEVDGACGPITKKTMLSMSGEPVVELNVSSSASPTATFTPRFTEPRKDNKYYISIGEGGWNPGIPRKKGSSLWFANCVFYALGRFAEIWGVWLESVNAEDFIGSAKRLGHKVSQKPSVGALIVWGKGVVGNGVDGAGHVACVEKINDDGSIVISQSGWSASKPFWTQTIQPTWYYGDGYNFLGFIMP